MIQVAINVFLTEFDKFLTMNQWDFLDIYGILVCVCVSEIGVLLKIGNMSINRWMFGYPIFRQIHLGEAWWTTVHKHKHPFKGSF